MKYPYLDKIQKNGDVKKLPQQELRSRSFPAELQGFWKCSVFRSMWHPAS